MYSEINTDKFFVQKILLEALDEHMGTLGSHKYIMIHDKEHCWMLHKHERKAKC